VEIAMTTRDDTTTSSASAVSVSPDAPPGLLAEVQLLNDDHTPMHFVVDVLVRVFGKDWETANRIMLEIHHAGRATCGIYPIDIADAKVADVLELARGVQYPLRCVLRRSASARP
jgi:ATP-dependent Clp protease adapter protein ClpS